MKTVKTDQVEKPSYAIISERQHSSYFFSMLSRQDHAIGMQEAHGIRAQQEKCEPEPTESNNLSNEMNSLPAERRQDDQASSRPSFRRHETAIRERKDRQVSSSVHGKASASTANQLKMKHRKNHNYQSILVPLRRFINQKTDLDRRMQLQAPVHAKSEAREQPTPNLKIEFSRPIRVLCNSAAEIPINSVTDSHTCKDDG